MSATRAQKRQGSWGLRRLLNWRISSLETNRIRSEGRGVTAHLSGMRRYRSIILALTGLSLVVLIGGVGTIVAAGTAGLLPQAFGTSTTGTVVTCTPGGFEIDAHILADTVPGLPPDRFTTPANCPGADWSTATGDASTS